MDWLEILISGLVAGFVAAITFSIMRKLGRDKSAVHYIVFAVVLVLAQLAVQEYILPRVASSQTESELLKLPIYQAIKEHEPEVYAQIKQAIQITVANKSPKELLWSQTRPLLSTVIERRSKTASDEALQQLSTVIVDVVTTLHARGDVTCYQVLFPQNGPAIDIRGFIGEDAVQRELAAQTAIIRSSATAPQPTPNEADVAGILRTVVAPLQSKYTNVELAMLEKPAAAGVNKRRICEMTADMYREVLKLPKQESGKFLRFMSGQ
jgi:hypothetical protein